MNEKRTIEPTKFVFVVGTPGAGKSSFCRELEIVLRGKGFECTTHGDYPFLQALFRSDIGAGRKDRFKQDPKSEFIVTDQTVYDEALKMIYESILAPSPKNKVVKIIEFSRPRYDTAFLYYTLRALRDCLIVNLSAPFQICEERNETRKKLLESKLAGGAHSDIFDEDPDLHYVPAAVMRNFYAKDTKEAINRSREQKLVLSLLPSRGYYNIDNSEDDKESFRAKARNIIENHLFPLLETEETYEEYYNRRLKQIEKTFGDFRVIIESNQD
jgi:adenylate kinase family enzyme